MFGLRKKNETTKSNEVKDFKRLANLVKMAVGHNTIPEFANRCGIPNSAKYIAGVIHEKISVYPEIGFLKKIAEGSEERISFEDLIEACGYDINDIPIDLRTVRVDRGWICWCDYGQGLDSEMSGLRPTLIIQNPIGNKFAGITMGIPLSTRISKNSMCTHIRIGKESGLQYESEILVEQTRVISKRRLMSEGFIQPIAKCPESILRQVEIALMKQAGLVDTRANESTVDRFLDKLNEYVNKAEESRINHIQSNNRNTIPQQQRVASFA